MAEKLSYEELEKKIQKLEFSLSECRLAEEERRSSEKKYRLLADNVTDIIWTMNMDLHFTYFSPSITRLQGFSVEEGLALSIEETMPPASFNKAMTLITEQLDMQNKGLRAQDLPNKIEVEVYCKDGSTIWTEVEANFLYDANGQPEGIIGATRDITERRQTAKELQDFKNRFRLFIDSSPDLCFLKDIEGKYLLVNSSNAKFFGKNEADIIGKTDYDLMPREAAKMCAESDSRAIKEGEMIIGLENVGDEIYESRKIPVFADDNVVGVAGIIRDITERKEAEKINKVLFAILDTVTTSPSMDDLYRSIHTSLSSIIDVTNFFIAIVDIKEETLYFPYHVDTKDEDFSPITNFNTTDSLSGFVVSQRKPVLLKKDELEKRARQNGVWGPVPLIWMGAPLIINDEVVGVVAVQSYSDPNLYTMRDLQVLTVVSDQIAIAIGRKRAENALRESEKKYRHLFHNAPAGIFEIDFVKGEFINVNEVLCSYSGYSEEEFLSLNPLAFFTEDSKQLYVERLEKIFIGERLDENVEYYVTAKDGRKVCVVLHNDFIYKNDKLTGAVVVVHDITDLKKAENEKIEAQKIAGEQKKLALVGQVAGKMAHDFNNILGVIMGNAELALIDCPDDQIKKKLTLIYEQTLRGKNLTKNLVAFAKDQEPKQEFFSINEKMELVISLLKKDLAGINVIREYSHEVPELLADPGMIEHAIVNLVQNSIHATSLSQLPKIIIRTYHQDGRIFVEVEDNGCGIPKEFLGEICEPAFTLKGSKDKNGMYKPGIKGTGYGMSNAKRYIEQHKGIISVHSELQTGTKVIINLPAIKKELTDKEIIEVKKETICSDKYILLVEDEQDISNVQYRILTHEPYNHKVDIAGNGQVAIDLLNRNEYDLISLDYILPGEFNGMDVYRYIRKTNKTTPILFISGNIEFLESIKDVRQRDPYIDHLSKPCINIDYVNTINMLLGRL